MTEGVKIGAMRARLQLQDRTRTPDGAGGYAETWHPVATIWAELKEMRGGESVIAASVTETADAIAVIRFRPNMTAGMRALHGSVIYNIRGVRDPDGRREWLELSLERGVAT